MLRSTSQADVKSHLSRHTSQPRLERGVRAVSRGHSHRFQADALVGLGLAGSQRIPCLHRTLFLGQFRLVLSLFVLKASCPNK